MKKRKLPGQCIPWRDRRLPGFAKCALETGHLAGVGLDVFWDEPVDPADPIFQYPVVATPHFAGATELMLRGNTATIAENVRRLVDGRPILNRLN